MKHLKLLALAVTALCLGLSANAQKTKQKAKVKTTQQATTYQCPMKCEGDKTYAKAGKCPVCNMNLKEVKPVATAYSCPMKCEGDKTYTAAGKCPVCNMNLKAKAKEAKKEESHSGHSH